jgi:hypothetical protein
MTVILELGSGHRLRFIQDGQGNRIGAIHEHPWPENPDGSGRCSGGIWFDNESMRSFEAQDRPRPKWTVVTADPLTLSLSIQCNGGCGIHGFIRNGRWMNV